MRRLPLDVRCRCLNLRLDPDGVTYWCCRDEPKNEVTTMLTAEQREVRMSYDDIKATADRLVAEGWYKNFERITELYHLMRGFEITDEIAAAIISTAGEESFVTCKECHIPVCCAIEGHCDKKFNGYR